MMSILECLGPALLILWVRIVGMLAGHETVGEGGTDQWDHGLRRTNRTTDEHLYIVYNVETDQWNHR